MRVLVKTVLLNLVIFSIYITTIWPPKTDFYLNFDKKKLKKKIPHLILFFLENFLDWYSDSLYLGSQIPKIDFYVFYLNLQ